MRLRAPHEAFIDKDSFKRYLIEVVNIRVPFPVNSEGFVLRAGCLGIGGGVLIKMIPLLVDSLCVVTCLQHPLHSAPGA